MGRGNKESRGTPPKKENTGVDTEPGSTWAEHSNLVIGQKEKATNTEKLNA